MPNISTYDENDEEYPFKPVDRNKIEQIFLSKNRERAKTNDKNLRKTRK